MIFSVGVQRNSFNRNISFNKENQDDLIMTTNICLTNLYIQINIYKDWHYFIQLSSTKMFWEFLDFSAMYTLLRQLLLEFRIIAFGQLCLQVQKFVCEYKCITELHAWYHEIGLSDHCEYRFITVNTRIIS